MPVVARVLPVLACRTADAVLTACAGACVCYTAVLFVVLQVPVVLVLLLTVLLLSWQERLLLCCASPSLAAAPTGTTALLRLCRGLACVDDGVKVVKAS